ncbi:MAG: DUF6465 family protein [Lachnospiraceae bacterium]|nr:DUF6465 family protein [Lachnospiraceae bacterium]
MARPRKSVKAEEVKTAVAEEISAVADAVKEAAPKSAPAKKATAKKAVSTVYVQYEGLEVNVDEVSAAAKNAWGGKKGDIETFDLYIKPEDKTAYYVINGTDTGSVAL